MTRHFPFCSVLVALFTFTALSVSAQQVVKKDVSGISTFAQLESTIACGGSTKPEAIREIKNMGFKSVINLRLATEQGADIERHTAVAKEVGIPYYHIPFSAAAPDPAVVDTFLTTISAPGVQPAFIH